MKRIHIKESQIVNEGYYDDSYPCAGTDFPYFYDEKNDIAYEASWNNDYGFPFGFWSDDYDGYNEIFSVGDAWSTHENACGKVARKYFYNILYEGIGKDIDTIDDKVNELLSDFKEYGFRYDEENDVYVSEDGSDEVSPIDVVQELQYDLEFIRDEEQLYNMVENALQNGGLGDTSALKENMIENTINGCDFTSRKGIDNALEMVGDDFNSFFERGNGEGRIWPREGMIGFYVTEQPDPEKLLYILKLLSEHEEIGVSYQDMFNFHMVFEDWRNNGEVTCCTISDYVDGNYGPQSYEDDEEEEEPIQYARQGETKFVPHLANQAEKRAFFKDFRDTRDRAVYAPRERGGNGSLAAYHAMRYPYGESNKRIGKIIKEEIKRIIGENT